MKVRLRYLELQVVRVVQAVLAIQIVLSFRATREICFAHFREHQQISRVARNDSALVFLLAQVRMRTRVLPINPDPD